MISRGKYLNWKREGAWTFWYENGSIKAFGKFKNHKEDGLWTKYDENGVKKDYLYEDGIIVE